MDWITGVTLGIAIVGAVLGVLNTWRSFRRDRPRMRVRPAHAIPVGGLELIHPTIEFAIEVVNRSTFALTVCEVGVQYRGSELRSAVLTPITAEGPGLPRIIGPREAVTFYMERPVPPGGRQVRCAYVKTSCGETFTGSSPALRQVINDAS